jgi:hypothetical protein
MSCFHGNSGRARKFHLFFQESIPQLTFGSTYGSWQSQETPQNRRRAAPTGQPIDGTCAGTGKGPLGLEPGHLDFNGTTTQSLGLPDAFRHLCPAASGAELLTQVFGNISFVGDDAPWALPRASTCARPQADGVQQRDDLGACTRMSRRHAVRQRHASRVREAVKQDPLAFTPTGDLLPAACARGNTSRRRPRTATESSRVLQQSRGCGLAWRRGCHPPASVAATGAPHSSTPMEVHAGDRTSGSQS